MTWACSTTTDHRAEYDGKKMQTVVDNDAINHRPSFVRLMSLNFRLLGNDLGQR
jgi:hypothetical protein